MKNRANQELRRKILQYFHYIASGQNVLQCIKQAIFLHDKFNPLLLFQLLSQGRKEVNKQDWSIYLHQNSIHFEKQQLDYLFRHYQFSSSLNFNQFMEALIPYNADVLRIFKKNYLQSIEIHKMDAQVSYMFRQLMVYWVNFFRNLLKMRKQISSNANNQDVEELIKQDLVVQNKNRDKVREAVKYKQNFTSQNFALTYTELRRFLQLWQIGGERNVQYDLLEIKRHFKNDNPFQNICWRQSKLAGHSPGKLRSKSTQNLNKANKSTTYSYKKQGLPKKDNQASKNQDDEENKYVSFKEDLYRKADKFKSVQQQQTPDKLKPKFKPQSAQVSSRKVVRNLESQLKEKNNKIFQSYNKSRRIDPHEQHLRDIRYARDKKAINGALIVQIFEEIATKQQILQKLRKKLANNSNFNLINLFKLIDHRNKGFVTQKLIAQFMENKSDIYQHLVKNYQREEGKLRFQDFCMIFRPLSKKLNEILDQRPEHRVPNPFKRQTTKILKQVINLTAELYHNLYELRRQINDEGLQPNNLFRYVDLADKGYIEAQDIKDLLEEKHIGCDNRDLKCIMKYFRKRINQTISMVQFKNFIDS